MIPGWLDQMEDEVLARLPTRETMPVRELADALGVSEHCATSYVLLLVSAGRIRIDSVSRALEAPDVRRAA